MPEELDGERIFGILKDARDTGCTCDVLITIEPDGATIYVHESDCAIA